jgi:hypothetical protein
MMLDPAVAAAERTEHARDLIARAQLDAVDLVIVSALDLCVLDVPSQPLFDERVVGAWMQLGDRRRRKLTEEVTARMVRRGLLIDANPQNGARQDGSSYSVKPELGLTLAARCRPAFIVIAAAEEQGLRPMILFALGDLTEPVQAVVAELPVALPPDRAAAYPGAGKLGPLGWAYRYVLTSTVTAAEMLARWTITPPTQSGKAIPTRYLVSAYRPDREDPVGYHLGVRGDGLRALVDRPGTGSGEIAAAEHDLKGLSGVMLSLIAQAS